MASETDIWSIALNLLGAEQVTIYDDPSKRARLCRELYPGIRDAVLRAYPWKCAREERQLARLATAPSRRFAYGYSLPTDPYCLWVPKLLNEDLDYEIMGRYLLSDDGDVSIVYIKRITDPGLFDSQLTQAIATRLASMLSFALTGIAGKEKDLWNLYILIINEARQCDSMEGSIPSYESDILVNAR